MKDADAKTSLFKTTGVVFISIGSLVFIAGLIWSLKTASFVMRASKTQGTVVEVERSRASKGGTMYYPIFTFTDASGIIHKQRTASGSSRYNFRPGQEVGILYDSDSPEKSEIDTFGTV